MASEEPGLKREIVTLVEDTAKELSGVLDACMKEGRLSFIKNCLPDSKTLYVYLARTAV